MASATATQDMVRPGDGIDLYYYDGETSKKQVFPTTQNTKFVQNFQNMNGGSSVFISSNVSSSIYSFATSSNAKKGYNSSSSEKLFHLKHPQY